MFWSGSRYGRSSGGGGSRRQQGRGSPVEVAVRNDRFFIGSRDGKRSEEPPVTTDGTYRIKVPDRFLGLSKNDFCNTDIINCLMTWKGGHDDEGVISDIADSGLYCFVCVGGPGFIYLLSVSMFVVVSLSPHENFETVHETGREISNLMDFFYQSTCSFTISNTNFRNQQH